MNIFNHIKYRFIKKALDDVKMDKNMKKVLVEYNTSIIEIMENKK